MMAKKLPVVLYSSLFVLAIVISHATAAWHNEIISGEHFDDLVATADGKYNAVKNTILVIHEPGCPPKVQENALPSTAIMYFVRYDVTMQARHVWYKPILRDDLKARYASNSKQCMEAYYFPKGASLSGTPIRWEPDVEEEEKLSDWAWDQVKTQVTFTSEYDETLIISQQPVGDGPSVRGALIYPEETVTIQSYVGYTIHATKTDRVSVVNSVLAGYGPKKVTLERFVPPLNIAAMRDDERSKQDGGDYQLKMHQFRFVQMIKQPVFVHNYTQAGYKKMRMPDDMFTYVRKFFVGHYDRRRDESLTKNELLVVNKGDVKTAMIDLNAEAIDYIVGQLQPILEEWCNCKLKFNQAYGIREYYAGNVLHKHVDSVLTHVISAILQVDQKLDGEDWNLETIGWDGSRGDFPMSAGDLVLYESARLIHGRPKVFQGRSYANCFFHFSPVADWYYVVHGDYLINQRTGWRESLSDFEFGDSSHNYRREEL